MRIRSRSPNGGTGGGIGGAALAGLCALVLASGCDSLLEVDLPTRIPAAALDDPTLAQPLVLSAQADFECALAAYIGATGLYTDVLVASTEFLNDNLWDSRADQVDSGDGSCDGPRNAVYGPVSTARFVADDAAARLAEWTDQEVPNRGTLLATTSLYAGYSLVLLGEAFCQAAIDRGPLMSPAQVLAQAELRFTTAITAAQAANATAVLNAARVGRARARLGQGKKAEAAADAALVPAGFQFNATYAATSPRRENKVNVYNYRDNFWSIDPRLVGLTVDGVADPRVQAVNQNRRGPDGITDLWFAGKYPQVSSPVRIASWQEAQLIQAEATGGAQAVERINAVRAFYGLPLYAGGTDAQVMAQIAEERRREFFLEGHRLGDMIRLAVPFDTGRNHKNTFTLGKPGCIPLPLKEIQNNPNA